MRVETALPYYLPNSKFSRKFHLNSCTLTTSSSAKLTFFFAWHRRYLFLADVFFVFGSNICTSCISYFGPRGRETIFDIAQADWFSFISISVLCSQVEIESWAVLQFQCLFHFFLESCRDQLLLSYSRVVVVSHCEQAKFPHDWWTETKN